MELFHSKGLAYQKEVYYLITKKEISFDTILQCLQYSSASFWHSLCVLTTANLYNLMKNELNLKVIQEICQRAELLVFGAYDGEGYIFWERQDSDISRILFKPYY